MKITQTVNPLPSVLYIIYVYLAVEIKLYNPSEHIAKKNEVASLLRKKHEIVHDY